MTQQVFTVKYHSFGDREPPSGSEIFQPSCIEVIQQPAIEQQQSGVIQHDAVSEAGKGRASANHGQVGGRLYFILTEIDASRHIPG